MPSSTTSSFAYPVYTNRDYKSIRQHLIDTIPQVTDGWTDHSESDLGIFLLSTVAYAADVLDFYLNRSAEQTNIITADQRESVVNLLKLVDYHPDPPGAAEVLLTFNFEATHPATSIPRGFGVGTTDGPYSTVIFRVTENTVVGENVASVQVMARNAEVVPNVIFGTSNGGIYQKYYIRRDNVVLDSLKVSVTLPGGQAERWYAVESLVGQSPTAKVFKSYYNDNGQAVVIFGDGIEGRVPPRDSVISGEIWYGGGVQGNKIGTGKLTSPLGTLSYLTSVTNAAQPSGGSSAKTTEQLKSIGPRVVRSLWSAKSIDDIDSLVENYPGVKEVNVLDIDSNVTNTALRPSHRWGVNVYVLPDEGVRPSDIFLSRIKSYLLERKITGVSISLLSPYLYTFNLALTIRIFQNYLYQKSTIHNNMISALDDYFTNRQLGQRVNGSDLISMLELVDGVDSVRLDNVDVVKEAGLSTETSAVVSSSSFDFLEMDLGEVATASNVNGNYALTYQTVTVL